MKKIVFLFLISLITNICNAQFRIEDKWLLHHSSWLKGSIYGSLEAHSNIESRILSESEKTPIEFANSLIQKNSAIKAILLIDKGQIVYEGYNLPANKNSMFHGYSVTKTLTSIGIGRAICDNIFNLNDTVASIDSRFKGTAFENATIKNLLTMSSGTSSPDTDSNFKIYSEIIDLGSKKDMTLLDATLNSNISKPRATLFKTYSPGDIYDYKSTDPVVLSLIFSHKTGQKFSDYLYENIFKIAGIDGRVAFAEDRDGVTMTAYTARLMAHDWAKFAIWVKERSKNQDCLGKYIRDASITQIKNTEKRFGKHLNGYGYFIWTENSWAKNSYWALGFGGQMIGWNYDNDRIMIAFSTVENWHPEASKLYDMWIKASQ